MWHPLARFIDYSILSLLAARRPNYLRDCDGAPREGFVQMLRRWEGATAEWTLERETGLAARYRVCVRGNGRELNTILYYERCPTPTTRLIIYHHGLGENPPTRSYHRLIGDNYDEFPADRIVLVAPGHVPGVRDLRRVLGRLEGFEEMFACGIVTAKRLAETFAGRYDRMVLAGVSLGGIVSLVEPLYEPRFAANISMLATPFLAAMLQRSSLSRMVDSRFRLRCSYRELQRAIDIDGEFGAPGGKLVMINGRADTMVDIELLRPWWRRQTGIEVHEIDASHLSMVFEPEPFRILLQRILRRELGLDGTMDGSARAV